jgi:hypothetical protein
MGEYVIRVLVAFEDTYRAYREIVAVGLRILHRYEVETSTIEALEGEIFRFRPKVVICYGHEDVGEEGVFGWIELSVNPAEPTKVRLGKRRWELTNPDLEELAEIIEQVG